MKVHIPCPTAVTVPLLAIVATAVLLLVQVPNVVGVLFPANTSPIQALASAIATVGLALTVKRMVSLHAPNVYLNL